SGLLDQRMLEAVLGLRPPAAFADEIEPLKLVQARANVLLPDEHALEQRQAEATAERGSGSQHLVGLCGKPVDAREEHLLDRRRDLDLDLVVETQAAVVMDERACVGQRADELFELVRVPFRLLEEAALELLGERFLADESQQKLPLRVARQRLECDLVRQMRVLAGSQLAKAPGGMV